MPLQNPSCHFCPSLPLDPHLHAVVHRISDPVRLSPPPRYPDPVLHPSPSRGGEELVPPPPDLVRPGQLRLPCPRLSTTKRMARRWPSTPSSRLPRGTPLLLRQGHARPAKHQGEGGEEGQVSHPLLVRVNLLYLKTPVTEELMASFCDSGIMTDELRSFLELNLPKVKEGKKAKFSVGVTEPKVGSHITEATGIPCQSNEYVQERLHFAKFIEQLKVMDIYLDMVA